MTTKISTLAKTTKLKRVNSILVSQPPPPVNTKTAFNELETKYNLKVDYRAFNHVEGVSEKDFRKSKIRPEEFNCIIFNSKFGIENFFRIAEEMRVKNFSIAKYFCLSALAITSGVHHYRKRKVFIGQKVCRIWHPLCEA